MDDALVFLVAGSGLGAVYAAIGLGIVTLYRATGVLNFAFGAMGMLAVFCYVSLTSSGVSPGAAAVIVIAVAPAGGALIEVAVFRWLRDADVTTKAVGSIALLVGLIGFVDLVWGSDPRALPRFLPGWDARVGGVRVSSDRIITFGVVMVVLGALAWLFTRTRTGITMRAMASDRETAALLGVPVRRLTTLAWSLAGGLAALSLLLVAPSQGLNSAGLSLLVVPGIAAAVIGDLRRPALTVAGGLALGIVEAEASLVQWTADRSSIVPFVVLLIVLLWRQRKTHLPALSGEGVRA